MALYEPTLKICLHDDLALSQQSLIYLHHDITLPTKTFNISASQ